jgi:hypothetical protein
VRLDAGPVGVGAKASRSGGEGAPLGARWSKEIRRRRGNRGVDRAEDNRAKRDPAPGEDDRGTELGFSHVGIVR